MKLKNGLLTASLLMSLSLGAQNLQQAEDAFQKGRLTPEALWSMGRIGGTTVSPDGKNVAYTVTTYDIKANKGETAIYVMDINTCQTRRLIAGRGSQPAFIDGGKRVAYLSSASGSSQVWATDLDGTNTQRLSDETADVEGFSFSPDGAQVILIKSVPSTTSIAEKDADLPLSSGILATDLMYKHWDQYVTAIPHPFVAKFDGKNISGAVDLLEGEPFECPTLPFGGIEQLAWSPDGKAIAYTCRKKTGRDYAVSTDSDIFLYDIATKTTRNLCKPADYKAPTIDHTKSLQDQAVNNQPGDMSVGYDENPQFSPDGRYIAWKSRERDGYESDLSRLCVYEFKTGRKTYLAANFASEVNEFVWAADSKQLYFTGVWHGKTQIYRTDVKTGSFSPLTDEVCDYGLASLMPDGKSLLVTRHSLSRADEIFIIPTQKGRAVTQLTEVNRAFYDRLAWGEVKERWVKTTDGQAELCWVVYPPHFDPNKKYPVLLFCEGGPQSPVSQFWSYRWNFQIMAANDYIIIAPNRRGLPGFGKEWLEEISGDYSGQCMQDYLSAIDDIAGEPYVDRERLGAVGASFGGYSVYWLAGNHDGRFKCFISHDGIFNTQQQYLETEEMWFANWDLKSAPWHRQANGEMQKAFAHSPHLYADKWDTPILCIHGQRDFRIEYTQAESAFSAARMRGIDAQLLLFPDENHWVLKPQNGILWQRTFFRWLDKYLKK
ncbi:MAG: prolyl oligopeptidase family serine peptidase [Alloprevotella sp.]